jgi:hypothetical protein
MLFRLSDFGMSNRWLFRDCRISFSGVLCGLIHFSQLDADVFQTFFAQTLSAFAHDEALCTCKSCSALFRFRGLTNGIKNKQKIARRTDAAQQIGLREDFEFARLNIVPGE